MVNFKLRMFDVLYFTLLSWWVFRSWGKLGTDIGGKKVDPFISKDKAIKMFTNTCKEKTGNIWSNSKQTFVKCAGKFYPLDIDFGAKVFISIIVFN